MGFVTPDYGTIFWMVISFGIVMFILKKFAWAPILKALKDREISISEALNSAESARKEVAGLIASNDMIIAEAKKEKVIIIKEARDIKDNIIAEARVQANLEAQKGIEIARQQIIAEKDAAISDIKKQVAELSLMIAEIVIRKQLENPKDQEILVKDLLKDLKLK
ncbi:MAG: F0F1 ATP synthase subunit B [Bacteroidota bacterium]|jgi:F-type H+-transporting ATPase subunit b|nr:F0F1 ATP synthase subunit B [Bacteroidota bacterium]